MRKNFPVTSSEYILEDGSSIVSKTDSKGRITYVNPYFIEVSGYTEAELMGAPHNLVRHPDMPEQAFDDLWKTLKTGALWTGLVKNRRKNGDHYWVRANVTPIREGGTLVGYMSVRTKPERQDVEAAEALYCSIREGRARGIVIHKGRVQRTGLLGWPARVRGMSLRAGLALGSLLQSVLFLLLAAQMQFALGSPATLPSWAILAALSGAGVSLGFWYWLRTSVVASLDQAIDMAGALAGGDLTHNVSTTQTNEMGQLLSAMQQVKLNLIAAMGDVRANVDSMNSATGEIAAGTMDLSSRTEMQASSLEQTASSMEQFASTVMQNADSAQQANQLARSASAIAQQGGSVVVKVGATMDDISSAARKVADIISVIDGIAFQTNILALNAAVEAARAGEHGRGFAVVATEVRHLAQRSAGAAKEIKTLIQTSVEKVDDGNALVQEARRTMDEMVASVGRVTEIVADIATASREQASGIQQVNQAVSHMDQVTQQNAALVEQAAAASASLHQQAAQLMQAVSVFNFAHPTQARSAVNFLQASGVSATARKFPAALKLVEGGLPPVHKSKVRAATRV